MSFDPPDLRSPTPGVDVNTDWRVDVTALPLIVVTNTSVDVAVIGPLDDAGAAEEDAESVGLDNEVLLPLPAAAPSLLDDELEGSELDDDDAELESAAAPLLVLDAPLLLLPPPVLLLGPDELLLLLPAPSALLLLLLLLGLDELLLLFPPLLVVGPAFPLLLLDVLVGPPAPPLLLDDDVSLLLLEVGDGSALLLVR